MKKEEVFSGKSVEEAKSKAAESFGVSEDLITFTVLEEAKTGFFGRIKSEAKVKAEYEEKSEAIAEEKNATVENTVSSEDNSEKEIKEVPAEKIEICREFIEKILEKMQIENDITIKTDDGAILVDIDSKGSGTIIGRRGETLDALQYLCSLVVNKGDGDYIRITLDSCGYRDKRAETLKALAEKISNKVLKSGRLTVLEPMNPYERRIIHSALQNDKYVTTYSEGDEPFRHVVVVLKKYEKNDRKYEKHYDNREEE